ncbi:ATP-binding protein [Dactylosporangium sp. CA-139114]|uniref:ATP-binding protein n=1 Tax=Dactylosporangium sp. CA-139114 TaxID=3239931 RepID=UPI003D9734EF
MRAEDLRARVERRGDATVVRLDGVLGVDSSPALRSTVLACLATEPSVIVLDVADLRHDDDVALTVLPALAQHAAAWPGSALTLAAASPPLASALDRMAVARRMPMYPTADAALAAHALLAPAVRDAGPGPDPAGRPGAAPGRVGGHPVYATAPLAAAVGRTARAAGKGAEADDPVGTRVRVELPPLPDATGAARHMVGRACVRWGFERVRDVAELVVTELVSNVLRHARTDMEVVAARDRGRLHISVRDHSSDLPRLGGRPSAPEGKHANDGGDAHSRADGDVGRCAHSSAAGVAHSRTGGDRPSPVRESGWATGEMLREDGRGLLVISALTRCWGCIPVPGGKVVWATVAN